MYSNVKPVIIGMISPTIIRYVLAAFFYQIRVNAILVRIRDFFMYAVLTTLGNFYWQINFRLLIKLSKQKTITLCQAIIGQN